ncbi:Arm DNA-binding domain-containing protein [Lonsdalea quercina]|uniref:Arm DNA-binding domain-containing protein n=1 Tax=Lonsdalea quercina TaxID=71657 RepID=UPI003975D534
MVRTDVVARTAKPREKADKLADAHGLYLLVSPNGSKRWYLKYRFAPDYFRCLSADLAGKGQREA